MSIYFFRVLILGGTSFGSSKWATWTCCTPYLEPAQSLQRAPASYEPTSMVGGKRVMPMDVFITDSEEEGDQEEELIQQQREKGALERDAALQEDHQHQNQHQHQHQHRAEVADQSGHGVIAATKVAWASGTDDESEGFPAVDLEREVERRKASPGGSSTYDVQLRKLKMQVILSLPLPGVEICGRVARSHFQVHHGLGWRGKDSPLAPDRHQRLHQQHKTPRPRPPHELKGDHCTESIKATTKILAEATRIGTSTKTNITCPLRKPKPQTLDMMSAGIEDPGAEKGAPGRERESRVKDGQAIAAFEELTRFEGRRR
jgi:hypothetical protein